MSGSALRQALLVMLVVLLATAAMLMIRAQSLDPVSLPEAVQGVQLREIGVSLYSVEPGISVSYMAGDGRWKLLGTITDELREQWTSGSMESWWTAQIEADQRVLSVLMVGPVGPGRRLELPIVDGQVRFAAVPAKTGPETPGELASDRGTTAARREEPVAKVPLRGAGRASKAKAGKADRESDKPSEISPEYKDNPY